MIEWAFITACLVGVFVLLSLLSGSSSGISKAFQRRWPAISEEEFLDRCAPGVDPQRALRVRQIIAEQLGIPYEHIYPEQRFVEDLHCN